MRCKDCDRRLYRPSARVRETGRCSACRGESRVAAAKALGKSPPFMPYPRIVSVTPDAIEAELRRQGFTPQER